MATFNEQLLDIVEDYRASGELWPATSEQVAEWAVAKDRFNITRGMAVAQCKEKIARAMRLEHVKDSKGRSVRKYYAARIKENGQMTMKWDDLNAERPFMVISGSNRRNQILGECKQLKNDLDSYNERVCPSDPIQVEFDFTVDLEEYDQLNEID